MWSRRVEWLSRAAARDGTVRVATVLQQAVVEDDRAGNGKVEREPGRDADYVAALRKDRGRQAGALGAENVGGVQRVAERGEVDRIVQQFDPDQGAFAGQGDCISIGVAPERNVGRGVSRVGLATGARVEAGADGEAEGGAEGVGSAE